MSTTTTAKRSTIVRRPAKGTYHVCPYCGRRINGGWCGCR